MASSAPAARPQWGPAYCTSPCCAARRAQLEHPDECGCPECQPGPGLDFNSIRHNRVRQRQARLRVLLQRENLTTREQAELDELLHLYVLEH
jgi:hypothetical protein